MSSSPRILCFGSLNIDEVYTVPHLVRPGETLASTAYGVHAGGKGANQAVAAARVCPRVHMAGKVGPDGLWLKSKLDEGGVNTQYVATDAAVTGRAIIQVDRLKGENGIVLFPGANQEIASEVIYSTLRNFGVNDMLLLQNEVSGLQDLLAAGRAAGLTVAFNPAPMPSRLTSQVDLNQVDILVLNETEGRSLWKMLNDRSTSVPEKSQPVLEGIHRHYPDISIIILTLGSKGVQASFQSGRKFNITSGCFLFTAHPLPAGCSVVDTSGAGDTWIGYFAGYLVSRKVECDNQSPAPTKETLPLSLIKSCIHKASAAAALSVTKHGAMDSIPSVKEVENFISELDH
ncbi:Cell death protease [Dispira parvispora]|uniref:Ribokinase n=1 Tax=Dispira parvispora TaxID=1520584 RepID=A0A9W8E4J5_9FUNG|nr:Cell death protease [Dispira parvispora]